LNVPYSLTLAPPFGRSAMSYGNLAVPTSRDGDNRASPSAHRSSLSRSSPQPAHPFGQGRRFVKPSETIPLANAERTRVFHPVSDPTTVVYFVEGAATKHTRQTTRQIRQSSGLPRPAAVVGG
jgi:hypothetical protein